MTRIQADILEVMRAGAEYTANDIEVRALYRGFDFGGPEVIGRQMQELQRLGLVVCASVKKVRVYRKAEKVTA